MQHQVFGAERKRPFDLSAKGFDGFLEKKLRRAGQVYKIIRVNDQWLQIIFVAQPLHVLALWPSQFILRPLARAGGKNLKRVAAQPIRSFGGVLNATAGSRLYPNPSPRHFRCTPRTSPSHHSLSP